MLNLLCHMDDRSSLENLESTLGVSGRCYLMPPADDIARAEALILRMVDARYSRGDLELLPPEVALPLHDALQSCRERPPRGWPSEAYDMLGRNDIALTRNNSNKDCRRKRLTGTGATNFWPRVYATSIRSDGADREYRRDDEADEFVGYDARQLEVARLLRCSRPVFFRLERPPELTDHDFEHCKQRTLSLFCTRSCASIPGRGMLTLGSLASLRTLAEALPVSKK